MQIQTKILQIMTSNKLKDEQEQSNSHDSEEDEDDEVDNGEMEDFLADDDEEIEYQAEEEERRRKRRSKKREHGKRRRRQEELDDELAEDDLNLLQENERGRGFTKLRKKHPKQDAYEKKEYPLHSDDQQDIVDQEEDNIQYGQDEEFQEQSEINDHFEKENNIQDIFEPGYDDFLLKNEDQTVIEHDAPQRLFTKFKDRLEENELREYLREESQWIYQKLRDKIDQRKNQNRVKQTIFKVLQMLRIQYCEIMYIYYYKRIIWHNQLTLDLLWKIYQLDDEWAIIRQMKRSLNEVAFPVLQSFNAEISPGVHRLLQEVNDIKTLRYIKEYADYELMKKGQLKKKEGKRSTVTKTIIQICQHNDILNFIQKDRVWLTPAQLYENIRDKKSKHKPKSPILYPKEEIQNYIKNRPYLTQNEIILSIVVYLKYQLFNYPDLRRWMKEKYTKRAVITTTPTKKGEEDIGLYSMYYPVKRIKKKPVASFKNDLWMLVTEAENANLIKVDITFEWELSASSNKSFDHDPIYKDMVQLYFDHSNTSPIIDFWNLLRKEILQQFISQLFIPFFHKEIKQDLTKDAEKQILASCGSKFRTELNKGPYLNRDGKPIVVMGMVLQGQKLGLAIVDEDGNLKFKGTLKIPFSSNLKTVVSDKAITQPIDEFKPDLIVVAANCRQSITLRTELRSSKDANRPERDQFSSLGDYEICSKIAKYQMMKSGTNEERAVLQAISLCRLQQNAMAEILNMWSQKMDDNGCLMLNLHPLQKVLNKHKLKAELQRVAVEMVNLVGIDLIKLKNNTHLQKQLQFVSGLGYKKSIHFLQKLKIYDDKQLKRRLQLHIDNIVGKVVYRNCSGFFKISTPMHQQLLNRDKPDKRQDKDNPITLLDLTRIHDESFSVVQEAAMVACSDPTKKKMDYQQCIVEVMRNPNKLRIVQFDKDTIDFDFICDQFARPFKDPRQPQRQIDNRDAFFSILRETPDTLKRYMVFSAKVVNTYQQFVNVKILDNGLFGSIRLPKQNKVEYTKDSIIKAIITRFPFDPEERKRENREGRQEQQLLKVQMSLSFPHYSSRPDHNCITEECYQNIIKQIHPKIDLNNFTIKKQDIPVLEVREQVKNRSELRLINHPKFKNMGITQAIEWISSEPIGQFVIRPSGSKKDYLSITWKFYEGVICHINLKAEARTMSAQSYCYRIQQKDKDRTYGSFDDMIQHYIKPMNRLMQDVISNRKFIPLKPEEVEQKLKQQRLKDPSIIHYYFGCSAEFPKFVILYYFPKENKFVKQLIRVKDTGLIFHEQTFEGLKELTNWFKGNYTHRDYQKYVPKTATTRTR